LYVFKKYNQDIWYFNADVHYLARITPKITLYPIGGIGLSALLDHYRLGDKEKINAEIRSGVNMGFGGEIRLTNDLLVGAEFRYHWTKQYYNQAMIMARAAYYF
jgi:opacity protein-like surface antigen